MREEKQNMDGCLPAAENFKTGENHWIQCKEYRCLGVFDKSGKWFSFSTGRELTDVVRVYSN